MREVELVFVFGALGAFIARLIEASDSIELYSRDPKTYDHHKIKVWWLVTAISIGVAGLGSCLIWALYTTDRSFATLGIDPALAGESFIVGLAGVGAVQRYMHVDERGQTAERNTDMMAEVLEAMAKSTREALDKYMPLPEDEGVGDSGESPSA